MTPFESMMMEQKSQWQAQGHDGHLVLLRTARPKPHFKPYPIPAFAKPLVRPCLKVNTRISTRTRIRIILVHAHFGWFCIRNGDEATLGLASRLSSAIAFPYSPSPGLHCIPSL